MSSSPACATTKLWKSLPPTGTVPENVSVVSVALGDVVVVTPVDVPPEVQAAAVAASVSRIRSECFMRRAVCKQSATAVQSLARRADLFQRQYRIGPQFVEDSGGAAVALLATVLSSFVHRGVTFGM
jgi:hypothetical protein